MARVTVEDCLKMISNRFILAIVAGKRARQLYSGATPTIDSVDNKLVVTALREIEEGHVRVATIEELKKRAAAKLEKEEQNDSSKPAEKPVAA